MLKIYHKHCSKLHQMAIGGHFACPFWRQKIKFWFLRLQSSFSLSYVCLRWNAKHLHRLVIKIKLKTIIQELDAFFREGPFGIQPELLNGGTDVSTTLRLEKWNKYQLFYTEGTESFQNIRNALLILASFSNNFLYDFLID